MDLRYTLTPVEGKDVIGYQLTGPGINGAREVLSCHVAQLGDQIVRAQLVAAGWTPPGEKSDIERKDALLREALEILSCHIEYDWHGKPLNEIDAETDTLADTITKELAK